MRGSITNKIVALSKADSCIVTIDGSEDRHVRFAQNMATTNGSPSSLEVGVESHFGKKSGSSLKHRPERRRVGGARRGIGRYRRNARRRIRNSCRRSGPQKYLDGNRFLSDEYANRHLGHAGRGDSARVAKSAGPKFAGFGFSRCRHFVFTSFANSQGLFVYDKETNVLHTVTARTPDGTGAGWAGTTHSDFSKLDVAGMGDGRDRQGGAFTASRSGSHPGKYTVILEPSAVSDLLGLLMATQFDQRSADEGRSFATKKGGGSQRRRHRLWKKCDGLFRSQTIRWFPATFIPMTANPRQRTVWIDEWRAQKSAMRHDTGRKNRSVRSSPLADEHHHGRAARPRPPT